MLCTGFDGASVMSGSKGGVHALLQRELNKEIPYTHCLNHQLHLVISHVCTKILSFFLSFILNAKSQR